MFPPDRRLIHSTYPTKHSTIRPQIVSKVRVGTKCRREVATTQIAIALNPIRALCLRSIHVTMQKTCQCFRGEMQPNNILITSRDLFLMLTLPCEDHKLKLSLVTKHKHRSEEVVPIGHIGCSLCP